MGISSGPGALFRFCFLSMVENSEYVKGARLMSGGISGIGVFGSCVEDIAELGAQCSVDRYVAAASALCRSGIFWPVFVLDAKAGGVYCVLSCLSPNQVSRMSRCVLTF